MPQQYPSRRNLDHVSFAKDTKARRNWNVNLSFIWCISPRNSWTYWKINKIIIEIKLHRKIMNTYLLITIGTLLASNFFFLNLGICLESKRIGREDNWEKRGDFSSYSSSIISKAEIVICSVSCANPLWKYRVLVPYRPQTFQQSIFISI